ncbi:hypothetical protein [Roseateles sp. BYS96W]|uniref:DUF4145 domain-containing protein n=1 Tax=Pelomonas nitida TaxID=3299027 RepID=A0ABW7GD50_9BURK
MQAARYQRRAAATRHRRMLAYELDDIRRTADLTRQVWDASLAERDAEEAREVAGMSAEDQEAYYEHRSDDHELLTRHIPNQHQYSLMVLAYSLFESRLKAVAIELRRFAQSDWSGTSLGRDSVVVAARAVVETRAQLTIPEHLWTDLDGYRLVRNAIAHETGEMDRSKAEVAQLLDSRPDDVKLLGGVLVLQPGFVAAFIEAYAALLNAILDQWEVAEVRQRTAHEGTGAASV